MARTMWVWVDHNVCGGHAMCPPIAPKVCALNANHQSEAVHPVGDTPERLLGAAQNSLSGSTRDAEGVEFGKR